jgi:hypothetical protein
MAQWLQSVAVTYGVWHAYKYVVKAIHHEFMPIFSLLENPRPTAGDIFCHGRKLAFVEKLFAALLLSAHDLRPLLDERVRMLNADVSGHATALADQNYPIFVPHGRFWSWSGPEVSMHAESAEGHKHFVIGASAPNVLTLSQSEGVFRTSPRGQTWDNS